MSREKQEAAIRSMRTGWHTLILPSLVQLLIQTFQHLQQHPKRQKEETPKTSPRALWPQARLCLCIREDDRSGARYESSFFNRGESYPERELVEAAAQPTRWRQETHCMYTCILYVYSHREGGGESWTREKVRGATVHKAGSKIPIWLTVSPVYKLLWTPAAKSIYM